LGISPVNINRSKSDHKKAVLLLCKGIAEVFRTNQAKLLQNPRIKESIEMAKIIAH
jgi:hypothetical protein